LEIEDCAQEILERGAVELFGKRFDDEGKVVVHAKPDVRELAVMEAFVKDGLSEVNNTANDTGAPTTADPCSSPNNRRSL
jgi:hypothetical protein